MDDTAHLPLKHYCGTFATYIDERHSTYTTYTFKDDSELVLNRKTGHIFLPEDGDLNYDHWPFGW